MKNIFIIVVLIATLFSDVLAEDNKTERNEYVWVLGKLVAIYHSDIQNTVQYHLQINKIKSISLDMSKLTTEKWQELLGKSVEIKVTKANVSSVTSGTERKYIVLEILYKPLVLRENKVKKSLIQADAKKPWINLLCKFSDIATEPYAKHFYEIMFSNSEPYLEHYWRESTFGLIDISGTKTVGWVTLPRNRSYYVPTVNGQPSTEDSKLKEDCINASGVSNILDSYYGINLFFNGALAGASFGGGGTTWIALNHTDVIGTIAHEMGHAYGLPHSSGRTGNAYDSPWDVLSGPCGLNNNHLGNYGCIPRHTIAFYKQTLGAININSQWDNVSKDATSGYNLHLSRLEEVASGGDYSIANIYSADGTKHYTVEARDKIGYDISLPAKAVIIHEIEDNSRAYVVDPDNNRDLSDAGTQWQVGETFSDSGISVKIVSESATGYNIKITAPKAKPALVTDIIASDNLVDKVRITWSPSSGAEYYKVIRYDSWSTTSNSRTLRTANSDTYYDDTVESFSTYYYRIKACNSAGCSSVSEYKYDSGKRNFIINASDGTYDDKVTITYSALPSFVSRFSLYRGIEGVNSYGYISNASILVDTTAQKNIRYNYWMVLFDSDNNQIGSGFDIGYISSVTIIDTDKDGIPDNTDTDDDNDGISDVLEKAHGLNPLNASDAQADYDKDGFSNSLEIKIGTDIRNAKSKPKWTPIIMDNIIIVIPSKP